MLWIQQIASSFHEPAHTDVQYNHTEQQLILHVQKALPSAVTYTPLLVRLKYYPVSSSKTRIAADKLGCDINNVWQLHS